MAKGGGGGQAATTQVGPVKPPAGANVYGGGGPPPMPGASGAPGAPAIDPMNPSSPGYAERMAAAENFQRQSLRGNREGRPNYDPQRMLAIMRTGSDPGAGGGGGGGVWIPPQTTQKITPGGGDQNAFSPQAATVENVTTPGRWAFANLMASMAPTFRKQSGTGDRQGGYG
jgi:hypothetical protein